jgi:beta-xylosidase
MIRPPQKYLPCLFYLLAFSTAFAQQKNYVSKVWSPDNKNGTFTNPVIHADYSDPDAIRVGKDFYLVASSFENIPGLPILQSRDLVNWSIIGHALKRQFPIDHFSTTRHGEGVWAPAMRYHNNEFYIYYPDPDFGIYVVKSKSITGPWSDPIIVQAGKGLIDPCPLWDADGKVYLVHAFAGSRAGFKSVLIIKQLNKEGTKTTDNGVIIYDGHEKDPTIEGPKLYKRNGYYYIFAPAGGVSTGWQLVLRSKNIYGPYERRVVMDQGSSTVNGPHQGAWVQTETGEDWFIHFQDKEAYGRVVHLQPMKWMSDWPVIGDDPDGDGKGEPLLTYNKPNVGSTVAIDNPAESDEFNTTQLGLQWQWQSNSGDGWAFPYPAIGALKMYAQVFPDSLKNQWQNPAILSQKFPAETFKATVKFSFSSGLNGDQFGLIVFGSDYAYLSFRKVGTDLKLSLATCLNADKGSQESETLYSAVSGETGYLQVTVRKGGICQFSFSADGRSFTSIGQTFVAKPGRWTGAKIGIFCSRKAVTNDAAYADVDWFRIEKAD